MNETAIAPSVGDTPTTAAEQMLSRVQANLIVSRRARLNVSDWKLDVQSPFWRLYFHREKGVRVKVAGKELSLLSGNMYLIPAWVRFRAGTDRELTQYYIHFYLTGAPPTLARQVFDGLIELAPDHPAIRSLVDQWLATIGEGGMTGFSELLWANALVQAAVASAIESLSSGRRAVLENWIGAANPVGPALRLIERELSRPPTNADLARSCGQSTDHFVRRFRAAVGLTPARYGKERRVAIAAQWLLASDRSIDDIALASGFADRFHFSRAFRAMIGIPPARFRAAHAAAERAVGG